MKKVFLLNVFLFISMILFCQNVNVFYRKECDNHYCPFADAGGGIQVRAGFAHNSANYNWLVQFLNTNSKAVVFTYVFSPGNYNVPHSIHLSAGTVSPAINGSSGGAGEQDLFIYVKDVTISPHKKTKFKNIPLKNQPPHSNSDTTK